MSHQGRNFSDQTGVQHTEYTIFGSSLTAVLLAVCLRQTHSSSVRLVMDPSAPFRLTRADALAFPVLLSPQIWKTVCADRDETLALAQGIGGRRATANHDAHLACLSSYGAEALDHLAQIAHLNGIESEGRRIQRVSTDHHGRTFRGIAHIEAARVMGGLGKTFENSQISQSSLESVRIEKDDRGHIQLFIEDEFYVGSKCFFVDDGIGVLPAPIQSDFDLVAHARTELVSKGKLGVNGTLIMPELGMVMDRQSGTNWHANFAATRGESVDALNHFIKAFRREQILALRRTQSFDTSNGFPAVIDFNGGQFNIVSSAGNFGSFLVPAIARFATEKPNDSDAMLWSHLKATGSAGIAPDLRFPSAFDEVAS